MTYDCQNFTQGQVYCNLIELQCFLKNKTKQNKMTLRTFRRLEMCRDYQTAF